MPTMVLDSLGDLPIAARISGVTHERAGTLGPNGIH